MRIESELLLNFDDVLIRPKISSLSSRNEAILDRTFKMKHTSNKWHGVPLIAANMDTVGTLAMAVSLDKFNCSVALHKFHDASNLISFYYKTPMPRHFYTLGTSSDDLNKFKSIMGSLQANELTNVCVDVANGYTQHFLDFIKKIRTMYPGLTIMAGNVATGDMTEALLLAGADIVKVGIGSGGACLTRQVAGVGIPQLSAIIECADAAHGLKGLVCSDGGCTSSGDIAKAFGAGADFVMLGSMLAGHREGGGTVAINGTVTFYGMSSTTAQEKYYGEKKNYRASEGRTLAIPFKGDVSNTIEDILGGIRSCMTYVGAASLKELSKRTTFVRVTSQLNTSLMAFSKGK